MSDFGIDKFFQMSYPVFRKGKIYQKKEVMTMSTFRANELFYQQSIPQAFSYPLLFRRGAHNRPDRLGAGYVPKNERLRKQYDTKENDP